MWKSFWKASPPKAAATTTSSSSYCSLPRDLFLELTVWLDIDTLLSLKESKLDLSEQLMRSEHSETEFWKPLLRSKVEMITSNTKAQRFLQMLTEPAYGTLTFSEDHNIAIKYSDETRLRYFERVKQMNEEYQHFQGSKQEKWEKFGSMIPWRLKRSVRLLKEYQFLYRQGMVVLTHEDWSLIWNDYFQPSLSKSESKSESESEFELCFWKGAGLIGLSLFRNIPLKYHYQGLLDQLMFGDLKGKPIPYACAVPSFKDGWIDLETPKLIIVIPESVTKSPYAGMNELCIHLKLSSERYPIGNAPRVIDCIPRIRNLLHDSHAYHPTADGSHPWGLPILMDLWSPAYMIPDLSYYFLLLFAEERIPTVKQIWNAARIKDGVLFGCYNDEPFSLDEYKKMIRDNLRSLGCIE